MTDSMRLVRTRHLSRVLCMRDKSCMALEQSVHFDSEEVWKSYLNSSELKNSGMPQNSKGRFLR